MAIKTVEGLPAGISQEVGYWLNKTTMGVTPTSTTLNPDFVPHIQRGGTYLDVGCGPGRISGELGRAGINVIGVDPNYDDLLLAKQGSEGLDANYIQSYGQDLPFPSEKFSGALLLATLGAVDYETRKAIVKETVRCLQPEALVYVAEFARITDPTLYTTDGKRWVDVYAQDSAVTGEYGSVIVHRQDGSTRFIGHHFTDVELADLIEDQGVELNAIRRVKVNSSVSGSTRDTWNVWGRKLL